MRKMIILFFMTMSSVGFAQDPELLDVDWYLQQVEIDGTTYFRPDPNFQAIGRFQTNLMGISHPFCMEGFGTDVSYTNPNEFTLVDTSVALIGNCFDPAILLFMEKHYKLYLLDNNFAKNPFSYDISTGTNGLTLTVTNGDGDIGIYGDQLLSTFDFSESDLKIYPNPVKDILYLENVNSVDIEAITIYDLMGRVVTEKTGDFSQIDMTNLGTGLFLLKIESEGHTQYEKIVKH